jgi:tRNA pseudouridine13 synthase
MTAIIDTDRLKQLLATPLLACSDIPGIGGTIKTVPEHFRVEEILPYAPCGSGEHLFITLRRSGWNTADVARELAARFDLPPREVGWGGRKDRQAVTTQTFSVPLPLSSPMEEAQSRLDDAPFEILDLKRHGNKIKTGHVAGNRFDILVTDLSADCRPRAQAIAARIKAHGIPNYYGDQRFGHGMRNLDEAAALFAGSRKTRGRKNAFLISALQSALFNVWLRERMDRGRYSTILPGDIAKKTDTGGMFLVDDDPSAVRRFAERQIVYTGPIFGFKMRRATEGPGAAEEDVLERFGLTLQSFKPRRAAGSRRAAIVYPHDLSIATAAEGLRLRFTLPAGAYATVLLRELTRH